MSSRAPRARSQASSPSRGIIGRSPQFKEVIRRVKKFAKYPAHALILGETGTGKELFARLLHDHSGRRGEFVAVDCTNLTSSLVESELFGHVAGAFTGAKGSRIGAFEHADRGTVFLDEVGELSLDAQAKLLRVLQEGTIRPVGQTRERRVDVRIVAATWRDIPEMVKQGKFREDLYYRLRWCHIELPPLRERGGDVILLARHFLKHGKELAGTRRKGLSRDARGWLQGQVWPGNVRQLQQVLFQAVVQGTGRTVTLADLGGLTTGESAEEVESRGVVERIVDELSQRSPLSASHLADTARVSNRHVRRALARLVRDGRVEVTGEGNARKYLLVGVPSLVESIDPRWTTALMIAGERGTVTRGLLAERAVVSVRTASRVLQAMVEAEKLTVEGKMMPGM